MKAYLVAGIAGLAMITMPVLSQTTTPTSNALSKPGPGAAKSGETLSHGGSPSRTNSHAAEASKSPGAAASPQPAFRLAWCLAPGLAAVPLTEPRILGPPAQAAKRTQRGAETLAYVL
jgi:hypothetical protein